MFHGDDELTPCVLDVKECFGALRPLALGGNPAEQLAVLLFVTEFTDGEFAESDDDDEDECIVVDEGW